MASAVCSRCSICERSVSGSLSSTSVLRNSIASQMPISRRVLPRYSRFFARTKSRRLVRVVEAVELADARADVVPIVAEGRLLLGLGIAIEEERFPLVEVLERLRLGRAVRLFGHLGGTPGGRDAWERTDTGEDCSGFEPSATRDLSGRGPEGVYVTAFAITMPACRS